MLFRQGSEQEAPIYRRLDRTPKSLGVGYEHTCVILDDDTVLCWGYGSSSYGPTGRLAAPRVVFFAQLIAQPQSEPPSDASVGYGDALERGGSSNPVSGLPPVDLGSGRTAKQVVAGYIATCALLDDDSVKCCPVELASVQGYPQLSSYQGGTPI